MTFDKPLPIPEDGIPLAENEKDILRSYYADIQRARAAMQQSQRAFDAVVTVIAARGGSKAKAHSISADFGFIKPVKEQANG